MPTTRSGGGGKNRKRGKNEADDEKRDLIFKEDGQVYAQVLRMLGNGGCEAMCIDETKRICHIRGKMHKKLCISAGDIILVGLQDDKADVILKYMPDEARLLKTCGELPESTRLNEGIADGLDEEDGGAGETWFEQNPHDLYSSGIKTSELQPQAEIKEMKGNDSPPSKKQKKNKDSSTPEIDDNLAVAAETTMLEVEIEALPVEAEVRPDSESVFINEAVNLEIPPGHDISLRDDPFNKFGLEMSQYIHSQNDADYYDSLLLPKFMKHFHNQVMIVDRMASHLGHSINKVLLQKEDLENNIKKFDFAKNNASKRISLLQEEVATIEAARNKAIANALAETKELLAASTAYDQGHIAETTELKVEIAELKKQLEESQASQASTSTKLSLDEILKLFQGTTKELNQAHEPIYASAASDQEHIAKIKDLETILTEKDVTIAQKDSEIAKLKEQLEHRASSSQELTEEEQFQKLSESIPYACEMVNFLKQGFEKYRRSALKRFQNPDDKIVLEEIDFYVANDEEEIA